jgi:MoaA/NifB/PqqE/SkfB family radical SAM enzyme
MIAYENIRSVHLEISTRCNAACPDCPRNFRGVDILDTYPVLDMKLAQAKQIFSVEFLQQLDRLLINGNYGDFVTAQDGVEIVEYFLQTNPQLQIEISTNAGARPKIWNRLGELGVTVDFRIDGLADTHKLYRQNTDFDMIINNAKQFILSGGHAVWNMILFDHNQHQVEQARELSRELGFAEFQLIDAGRNTMPVFTSDKRLSHIIGNYTGSTDFDKLFEDSHTYLIDSTGPVRNEKNNRVIDCYAKKNQEIYIAANGEVYPCCWLGFYPTYSDRRSSNPQLKKIIFENNALEYGIKHATQWFNSVEQSWNQSVPEGKIFACNEQCGIRE